MNTQPIEKAQQCEGYVLDVVDVFTTIQGEGPHSGKLALFIRLGGCNLQCPQCDTNYTKGRRLVSVSALYEFRTTHPVVVITGGEPFRQNIGRLCRAFLSSPNPPIVQIESNGTLPPPQNFPREVEVVCSPKTGSINKKLLPHITAYKYVVPPLAGNLGADWLPVRALDHPSKTLARPHSPNIPVYLTPEQDQGTKTVLAPTKDNLFKIVKKRPECVAQCQLHKVLEIS